MDVLTKEQRSRNMAAIKGTNTAPELLVRSVIHRMGFRFGLHRRDLPGRPDIVLTSRKKLIFVHGCFWHIHNCRYGRVVPATNAEFWSAKRKSNVQRDKRNREKLKDSGWKVLTIWECWTKDISALQHRLAVFLNA
jgi:DNA mismatch endonuclease, patch repair protein